MNLSDSKDIDYYGEVFYLKEYVKKFIKKIIKRIDELGVDFDGKGQKFIGVNNAILTIKQYAGDELI